MKEDHTWTETDEMLDFLCWNIASSANHFHPVDETAAACVDAIAGEDDDRERALAIETAVHADRLETYTRLFQQLYNRGYDPRGRAVREAVRAGQEMHNDPDEQWDAIQTLMPDFEWWDDRREEGLRQAAIDNE